MLKDAIFDVIEKDKLKIVEALIEQDKQARNNAVSLFSYIKYYITKPITLPKLRLPNPKNKAEMKVLYSSIKKLDKQRKRLSTRFKE